MKRASWAIALLVLISTFHLAITIVPENVGATTLYVGGTGPGNFTTIQGAINSSNPGDTIFVYNGSYQEHLEVRKTLTLIGESQENTTIDGGGYGSVVNITADWVNITRLSVANSGPTYSNDAGLDISFVSNCSIENVTLFNNSIGIKLMHSTYGIIRSNNITGNRRSIFLESSDFGTITRNIIDDSYIEGVYLSTSHNALIANNTINSSRLGGIEVWYSDSSIIFNNTVTITDTQCIYLVSSSNSTLAENDISWCKDEGINALGSHTSVFRNNTILNNDVGLVVIDSFSSSIIGNNISNNSGGGLRLSGDDSKVIGNTLLNNSLGIAFGGTNNTLLNNVMTRGGVAMGGDLLENWNTHILDVSNELDGRPIIYWKNASGGSVSPGAAQIILANCTDVNVENQNVSSSPVGISIAFSNAVRVTNTTFPMGDRYEYSVIIFFSHNVTVSNNTISTGSGSYSEYSNHITIDNNSFMADRCYIEAYTSNTVKITNNSILSSDRLDMMLIHINDLTVRNNSGPGVLHIYIDKLTGGTIANNSNTAGFSAVTWTSSNLTFAGNPFTRGLHLYNVFDCTIENNNITQSGQYAVRLDYFFDGKIIENSISESDYGIAAFVSSNNIIANNTISRNGVGIYLNKSSCSRIENNTLSYSFDSDILLEESGNNTIHDNSASSVSAFGIRLYESSDNTLNNNMVSLGTTGVSLHRSHRNLMENNTIEESRNGIIFNSDYNTIVNNTVFGNRYGVLASYSNHNRIYHNNFIDNLVQAEDYGNYNVWDNGYPSGGNYWSDYIGVDINCGPNQDILGSDGIGDTPYVVPTSASDRYPLMAPFGMIHPLPPTMLSAELSGLRQENVTLRWILSADDGRGSISIEHYEIFRGQNYRSDGVGYIFISALPNGTSEFIDSYAGEGNPDNYYYRVCAIDIGGNASCSMNQAGKFTRHLLEGVNILSVPLVQSDEGLQKVFQTMSFDEAWSYDSASLKWRSITMSKPYFGDFRIVNCTMGFWVNLTADSNFTVAGLVPIQTIISLKTGWNLVGFPSFNSSYTTDDLRIQIGATRIEGYDPTNVPYYLRQLFSAGMLAGRGYWVWVDTDATWTVTNH